MDELLNRLLGFQLPQPQAPAYLQGDTSAIQRQAQQSGLLNAAMALLEAGGPSQQQTNLGQAISRGAGAYQQGVSGSFDQTLKEMLAAQQMQDAQRKRAAEERQRAALDQYISSLPPEQQGRALAFPEKAGEAAFSKPKFSVQSIYDPEGREVKVRLNEDTGTFSPLGGAKAENFVQIDRGNVIELRTPSGKIVGSLPKGVAPTAPSYTMTDFGVMNTRSGQITPPTGPGGQPIAVNQASKASEDERKSLGFYNRMQDATNTINSPVIGSDGKPVVDSTGKPLTIADVASKPELFAEIVGGIIPNWLGGQAAQNKVTSTIRQQYEQAQQNWVRANLRAESGAAIGVDEMAKEIRTYFPQIGDSPETIKQKQEARKVTEESMRARAGRAIPANRNVQVGF